MPEVLTEVWVYRMTRDDLIAAGWVPWCLPEVGNVWEHPKWPGKQFSFMAACLVQEETCEEKNDHLRTSDVESGV